MQQTLFNQPTKLLNLLKQCPSSFYTAVITNKQNKLRKRLFEIRQLQKKAADKHKKTLQIEEDQIITELLVYTEDKKQNIA